VAEVKVRAHVYISGMVQGVFFRWHTKEEADKLGVKGWVRNLTDGRVEAVFEGEKEAVDAIIEFCKRGPPLPQVEKVKVKWEPYKGEYGKFKIIR
jgi:acylphosphatase